MPIFSCQGPIKVINSTMFWGAFHDRFVPQCLECSFPGLVKVSLLATQCAITGLGLTNSGQKSLDHLRSLMVQENIPSCCFFLYLELHFYNH